MKIIRKNRLIKNIKFKLESKLNLGWEKKTLKLRKSRLFVNFCSKFRMCDNYFTSKRKSM